VNARGTLNVLLASRACKVKRVIYWSTSEVYGTAQTEKMSESHPLNPHSTYAVSKLAADRLCYTFWREHKVPVTILRQFNCYGPRETWPYVIPRIIEQLYSGYVAKLGNMLAERDFTFAEDAARAGVDLMECDEAIGETVNAGTGVAWPICDILGIIKHLMGKTGDGSVNWEIDPSLLRPFDVDRLVCDFSKLNRLTGWMPQTPFHKGLDKTIEWFREHGGKWDYRGV